MMISLQGSIWRKTIRNRILEKFNLCCTFLSDMVEYGCGDKISKVLVGTLGDFVAFFTYSVETNWLTVKE